MLRDDGGKLVVTLCIGLTLGVPAAACIEPNLCRNGLPPWERTGLEYTGSPLITIPEGKPLALNRGGDIAEAALNDGGGELVRTPFATGTLLKMAVFIGGALPKEVEPIAGITCCSTASSGWEHTLIKHGW